MSPGCRAPGPQGKPLPSYRVLVGGGFPGSCPMQALHACTSQASRSPGCIHPRLAPHGLAQPEH